MKTTLDEIVEKFDKEFSHEKECQKLSKELKEKFNMQLGDSCGCYERERIKKFLIQACEDYALSQCDLYRARIQEIIDTGKKNDLKKEDVLIIIEEYLKSSKFL